MAIWKPENVMLTQKGRELLSKAQVGQDTITVSRVVVGGSSIPYANLYTTTAISGIRATTAGANAYGKLNITDVQTSVSGSVMQLELSNEGCTTPYSVYTIGIYVKNSANTEILYQIMECDITQPDLVPIEDDTFASMYYNIYMEHANAQSVTVNVTAAGSIPTSQKGVAGGVATLDSSGKIPSSQLPSDVGGGFEGRSRLFYCECSTYASTASKTGTLVDGAKGNVSDITSLFKGLTVAVKFTKGCTIISGPVTFNANGLGAKTIVYPDGRYAAYGSWKDNEVVMLTYDGTNWVIMGIRRKSGTVTLTTSWTSSDGLYSQSLTAYGLSSDDSIIISPVYSGTLATDKAIQAAWNLISRVYTSTNSLEFQCFGSAPTVQIPLQYVVVNHN